MRAFMVFLFTVALGMLIIPPLAMAHGGLKRDIAALDDTLVSRPMDVHALLHRADLLRLEGSFTQALEDLERVEGLQPGSPEAAWVRARIMVDQHREAAALGELDLWLAAHPGHVPALVLRAEAHHFVGDLEGAARDYQSAIESTIENAGAAEPEWFTALATVRQRQAMPEEALATLERGLNQLGPLLSLQIPALELELALTREDQALKRMGRILANIPRKEAWLVRRAELLERMGRPEDAQEDWAAVITACELLPLSQRNTRAVQTLLQRARSRAPAPTLQG